jgi:DNA-binding transcriptional regulator GbsR (MarR family)
MNRDKVLIFSDHVGRFYAERYGFPPVTGRLIGYLSVCEPARQTINEIAATLLTSRSAINNAINQLETQNLVNRVRPAGNRADLISFNANAWQTNGFDPSEYIQTAALLREGLEVLGDGQSERRKGLEMSAALNDFMAERLPQIYEEFLAYHQKVRGTKKK